MTSEEESKIETDISDIVAIADGPIKRFFTRNPLFKFITNNIPLPFAISELFYGTWMSCIAVNIISGFSTPSESTILYAISAAFMVNIIWGSIDGWTYNLARVIETAEDDRFVLRLMRNPNDKDAKDKLLCDMYSGPMSYLSLEDMEKVVDMILTSKPDIHPRKRYGFIKQDFKTALAFVMIDVTIASLTILPFILTADLEFAMILSRGVTILSFSAVAFISAKYMNRNWITWVAIMSALGLFISQATFLYS